MLTPVSLSLEIISTLFVLGPTSNSQRVNKSFPSPPLEKAWRTDSSDDRSLPNAATRRTISKRSS